MPYNVALVSEENVDWYHADTYPDVQAIEALGGYVHVIVLETTRRPAGAKAERGKATTR